MLVDSHCHLNFLDLKDFNNDIEMVIQAAKNVGVEHFLCVCVQLEDYPKLIQIAEQFPEVSLSVGLHPNEESKSPVDASLLVTLADHPSCIAIGETGLDYYRTLSGHEQDLQRQRFCEHIRAAIDTRKPLIIHTRQAASDTLKLMREENAQHIGGVMHCFAESLEVAFQAIEMNFYISFSGIVTFKNALELQEVARSIPLNKILIETDCPYLAPVPFRGKQNQPAYVKLVAEAIASLRGISFAEVAEASTHNFYECFKIPNKRVCSI